MLRLVLDDLDAAVFAAVDRHPLLSSQEVFANVVALNAESADEEHNGLVR